MCKCSLLLGIGWLDSLSTGTTVFLLLYKTSSLFSLHTTLAPCISSGGNPVDNIVKIGYHFFPPKSFHPLLYSPRSHRVRDFILFLGHVSFSESAQAIDFLKGKKMDIRMYGFTDLGVLQTQQFQGIPLKNSITKKKIIHLNSDTLKLNPPAFQRNTLKLGSSS